MRAQELYETSFQLRSTFHDHRACFQNALNSLVIEPKFANYAPHITFSYCTKYWAEYRLGTVRQVLRQSSVSDAENSAALPARSSISRLCSITWLQTYRAWQHRLAASRRVQPAQHTQREACRQQQNEGVLVCLPFLLTRAGAAPAHGGAWPQSLQRKKRPRNLKLSMIGRPPLQNAKGAWPDKFSHKHIWKESH